MNRLVAASIGLTLWAARLTAAEQPRKKLRKNPCRPVASLRRMRHCFNRQRRTTQARLPSASCPLPKVLCREAPFPALPKFCGQSHLWKDAA